MTTNTADLKTKLDQTQIREEGNRIIVEGVKIARTGNQKYMDRVEFRPEDEVFSSEHMASIEGVPITVEHPKVPGMLLNPGNREAFSTGRTTNIRRDGDFLVADLHIDGTTGKQAIANGIRGVSMGYTSKDKAESGIFNGQAYDSIQTTMRANHLALVANPRCGEGCRFDSEDEPVEPTKSAGSTALLL